MKENKQKVRVVIEKNYPRRRAIAAFASVFAMLIAAVLFTIPFSFGGSVPGIVASVLITVIAEIAAVIWLLHWSGLLKDWKSTLFLDNFKWKHVFLGLGVGVACFILLQLTASLLGLLGVNLESSDTSNSLGNLEGWRYVVIFLIFVPLVIPFVEEVLFRGLILGLLQKTKLAAPWIGILTSAVYFGAVHIQGFSSPSDFILVGFIGIMGAVYAYLVLKTKSLYTSYAAHLSYNGVTVIMSLIAAGL